MTLTYIFHSGFVLETEQSILVFDYWMDPSGMSAARALLACYWRDARTAIPLVADNSSSGSKSGLFVPMHFTTGFEPSEQREQSRTCSNYAESRERKSGAQSSWRMKEFTDEKNIPFWKINREGETIEI